MANWKYCLNLKDLWEARDKEEISIQELGNKVAERIKQLDCYKKYVQILHPLVMEFKSVEEDVEAFDDVLDDLYDWADTPLFTIRGEMQRKICWITTAF